MKNYTFLSISILLFVVLLSACNSSSKSISQNKEDSTKVIVTDALEKDIENKVEQIEKIKLPFIEDNFSEIAFPLQIDTVIFEGRKKLPTDFLLKLEKMVTKNEQRYALQFPSFVKLNKLKTGQDPVTSGKFDIGESIQVTYYDMGYTFIEQKNSWLAFVGVEYEPYPACPWGSGREIVLSTFDTEGNLIDLFTIAENSEGGDPPAWGKSQKKVFSENGQEYTLDIKNIYGENDDNGDVDFQEVNKETQKISIQEDGKLKIDKSQKKE
ncbi:hypothetical protein WAF17_18045 [Bernardetia sp. ABR2-2B]|uniref:hypothetical protein n=1 Tax=Bernardetia sp. ABR2-2B TaxID=3127472 RepID=UPI0030CB01E2